MPWKEATAMSLRFEFVQLAMKEDANISQLCHDFGISRKIGYKWLMSFQDSGRAPTSRQSPIRPVLAISWRDYPGLAVAVLQWYNPTESAPERARASACGFRRVGRARSENHLASVLVGSHPCTGIRRGK